MKSLQLLLGLALITLATRAHARVSTPAGKVSFNLTVLVQQPATVSLRTNITSRSSNTVQTVTSRTKTAVLLNRGMLKLLANSITSLPANVVTNGSLQTDGEGQFFVVTDTTTNYVSNVLRYTTGRGVFSGKETIVRTTPAETLVSETESATSTQFFQLTYNDNFLTTGDGTHTSFVLSGSLVTEWGDHASKFTCSLHLTGGGDGMIQDKFIAIKHGDIEGRLVTPVDLDDRLGSPF